MVIRVAKRCHFQGAGRAVFWLSMGFQSDSVRGYRRGTGYTQAMVLRLHLHPLPGEKRAGELASLVDSLYKGGASIVIWVADEGRRQILDDYLWTFQKLAFIPHSVWQTGLGEVEDPIVLVGEEAAPNGATTLVVGDDLPPGEWAATFADVHDLIPPGEAGDQRRQRWQQWRVEHGATAVEP